VVASASRGFPPFLHDLVLVGGRRVGQVRQRRHPPLQRRVDLGQLRLELLDLRTDLAHPRDRVRRILARLLRPTDRVRDLVALRAKSFQLRQDLAPPPVQSKQLVDGVSGTAARQSRAHLVGLAAEKLQVEHRYGEPELAPDSPLAELLDSPDLPA
jgi:hypothetical protein